MLFTSFLRAALGLFETAQIPIDLFGRHLSQA